MSITQCQPRKDALVQPCITALDNWWSLVEIYNTSSCTYGQSSSLFVFKLHFHWRCSNYFLYGDIGLFRLKSWLFLELCPFNCIHNSRVFTAVWFDYSGGGDNLHLDDLANLTTFCPFQKRSNYQGSLYIWSGYSISWSLALISFTHDVYCIQT